jgi:GNAT superfamily N-acetyltransferase
VWTLDGRRVGGVVQAVRLRDVDILGPEHAERMAVLTGHALPALVVAVEIQLLAERRGRSRHGERQSPGFRVEPLDTVDRDVVVDIDRCRRRTHRAVHRVAYHLTDTVGVSVLKSGHDAFSGGHRVDPSGDVDECQDQQQQTRGEQPGTDGEECAGRLDTEHQQEDRSTAGAPGEQGRHPGDDAGTRTDTAGALSGEREIRQGEVQSDQRGDSTAGQCVQRREVPDSVQEVPREPVATASSTPTVSRRRRVSRLTVDWTPNTGSPGASNPSAGIRVPFDCGIPRIGWMESITFREPTEADVAELEALITAHFSEGSSYTVDPGVGDPTYNVRVAEDEGSIRGVMAINVLDDPGAVAEEMYFFDDPDLLPAADRYGLLEMGYVRPDATGRGIGSRLLERVESIGIERGGDCLLSDSWYHGGPDSPEHLFEKHGYETVYRDPFDRPAAECPKCDDHCVCAAGLVARNVE